jgi:hypothetical protein
MSKIYVMTQDYENYGSEDEPYWKPKGGSDYFIPNFTGTQEQAIEVVNSMADKIEYSNEYATSTILGVEVVADDYMTEFEQSQLDYEGQIRYPAKVLEAV